MFKGVAFIYYTLVTSHDDNFEPPSNSELNPAYQFSPFQVIDGQKLWANGFGVARVITREGEHAEVVATHKVPQAPGDPWWSLQPAAQSWCLHLWQNPAAWNPWKQPLGVIFIGGSNTRSIQSSLDLLHMDEICRKFFGAGEMFRTHWPSVMTGCSRKKLQFHFQNTDLEFGAKCAFRSMDGLVLIPLDLRPIHTNFYREKQKLQTMVDFKGGHVFSYHAC